MIPIDTQLTIPNRDLFPLLDAAERRGLSLAEFMLQAARAVAHLDVNPDSIRELHALGLSDAQIARELAMTNLAVADRRRALHLPANRRPTKGSAA